MRKILICLIGAIILSNTQFSCRESNAQDDRTPDGEISLIEKTVDGMKYMVFYVKGDAYGGKSYSIEVVNVTRDKLQCEIISTNLKKIKNGNTSTSE